jgi:GT2 family glycosyltransferase
MINIAESNPQIGIVNPSSNTLGQRPKKSESLESYILGLKKESNEWEELASCTGFCMLIKQEVIEKIGDFDEIYGMGNFEDTDFSFRAKSLGYKCVRAKGAYVLHQEKASFKRLRNWNKSFKKNQKIFWRRWGIPQRVLYIVTKINNGYYERVKRESLELVQKGNWVTIFKRRFLDTINLPSHSNINLLDIGQRQFYLSCLWKILKKKKKFNIIYTDNLKFNNLLKRLKFIHKAKLKVE